MAGRDVDDGQRVALVAGGGEDVEGDEMKLHDRHRWEPTGITVEYLRLGRMREMGQIGPESVGCEEVLGIGRSSMRYRSDNRGIRSTMRKRKKVFILILPIPRFYMASEANAERAWRDEVSHEQQQFSPEVN